MRYRTALLVVSCSALPAAPVLSAERVSDPAKASVFIRVVGKLQVEVDSSWTESVEERDVEIGTGSGFVFTPYGHVLTNYHVVDGGSETERFGDREVRIDLSVERIEVILPGSNPETPALRLPATVEVSDAGLDLAVLSVSGADLPYLGFGDSDAAEPGEDVIVYGFPFGREVEVGKAALPDILPTVSMSRGAVAAARADDAGSTAFLQTSATVNPGNSGGPMVDAEG
ncbi:MAG: S1C family serine protease, partial [Vicinamibacteria bacterium]